MALIAALIDRRQQNFPRESGGEGSAELGEDKKEFSQAKNKFLPPTIVEKIVKLASLRISHSGHLSMLKLMHTHPQICSTMLGH